MGIDPGTLATGYGMVIETADRRHLAGSGVIAFPAKMRIEERLSQLHSELRKVIQCYQPEEVAIEEPFVALNVRSALAIGRAQAVAILAATDNKVPIYYYSPAEVKKQVTGYGGSDKEQIKTMVQLQLGLDEPIESSDAADAIALAICHLCHCRFREIVSKTEEKR